MEKVILLAYHFSPEEGSCSDKNFKILTVLVEAGFEVVVVTKNSGAENSVVVSGRIVRIIRIGNGVFHRAASTVAPGVAGRNLSLKSRLKKWISLRMVPDAAIDWLFEAMLSSVLKQELVSADIVVSTSSPYTSHLVANFIWRKYKIPYVLTYGDPWIYEPKRKRSKMRYLLEKTIEAKVVNESSSVLVITKYNKEKYMQLYNLSSDKVRTFQIGMAAASSSFGGTDKMNKSCFSLVYGGSLDPVHRNPIPFIEAMREIDGVKFSIYNNDYPGLIDVINSCRVQDKVKMNGLISQHEFDDVIDACDGLLLFGNAKPFQIPGKVYAYIATGKSIFYIKNNDDDNDGTLGVLKDYENFCVAQNNVDSILGALPCFIDLSSRAVVSREELEKFSFRKTMAPIAVAVRETLEGKNRDCN